ncbi:hypothetical protein [Streptomyces sp. PR69]|uniref:hypothetical protein n=1 Tax=Streptomyces sp. PR69 TaxID=2984950 RepID=UPI0022650EEE|nr:hypothetical protein [Streptomyces sp. PR69]
MPQEPEETEAPDGELDPEASTKGDEAPARRRHHIVQRPFISIASHFTAHNDLHRSFDSPLQRMLRNSALIQLGTGPGPMSLEEALRPALENTIGAAVRASLNMQSPLDTLDLRNLMPGGFLSRSEALRIAGSTPWERLQALDPENWRGELLNHVDMLTIMGEGIPLVWTPPANVIRELLKAQDAPTRRRVLERQAADVVKHCRAVLADVARRDLTAEVDLLSECLDSIDSDRYASGQVLASSVLDTILRAMVRADSSLQNSKGGFTFKNLAAKLPTATPNTLVGQFRAYCLHTSIHKAYEPYHGPPVPEEYNRHASTHAAGPTQITLANALAAVMLAIGLIRELEETMRALSPAG